MSALSGYDGDLGRGAIADTGQIHFACANAEHRGQGEAVVTVRERRWAYCEGTPSATEHEWVKIDPPIGIAELELARLVRTRASASRVAVGVGEGPTDRASVSGADTRRARKESR